jgi:3-oxoacyl-[acyl-carrier protein] reductase
MTALRNDALNGRHAIVTGGARGIGLAIARRYLAAGASVALWDVDAAVLTGAQQALAPLGTVSAELVDVRDEAQIARAASQSQERFGAIDILVNNAGVLGPTVPAWEHTPAQWRNVLDVNLTGAWLCCRAVAPVMLAQRRGRIVNIASVAGKEGNGFNAAYSASKAGLIALTKSLGKELATTGVLVNVVAPAVISTPMNDSTAPDVLAHITSLIPMRRIGRAEEVAELVAWLASDKVSFSTGAVYDISGGRATY